jgi:hypothetical protein
MVTIAKHSSSAAQRSSFQPMPIKLPCHQQCSF